MAVLTREQIREAMDLEPFEMDIPEWGGSVMARGLSLEERQRMLPEIQNEQGETDSLKASLAAMKYGVVEPQFTEDDYEWLQVKNAGVLDRIAMAVIQHSGMSSEVTEAVKRDF